MSRKRLAIIVPKLFGGGAERVAAELSTHLDAEVHYLLFEDKIEYPHAGEVHVLGSAGTRPRTRAGAVAQFARIIVEARRLKRRLGVDASLSMMPLANFVNVLSRSGERVVVSSRSTESVDTRENFGRWQRPFQWLIRALYPRADSVIAISKNVGEDLQRNFGVPRDNIDVIYNPVPLARLAERADLPVPDALAACFTERPVIVCAGRLMAEKGHLRLVRALSQTQTRPRLIILGRGALAAELVRVARRHGLSAFSVYEDGSPDGPPEACDVVLGGFLENPHSVIAKATLFAFPSLWEGLGQALLEALACGAAVMAADCRSGPREILAPETPHTRQTECAETTPFGLLMPVFAPGSDGPISATEREWARAIDRWIEDEAGCAEFRRAARRRATDFAADAIIPLWESALFGRADQM